MRRTSLAVDGGVPPAVRERPLCRPPGCRVAVAVEQDGQMTHPLPGAAPENTTRTIDAAIFDLGGVLMHNGRHSDFVRRYPAEHAEQALRLFMGEFGTDGDHPWHRLERGEISMAECQALNRAAFEAAGIPIPQRPPQEPVPPGTTHRR